MENLKVVYKGILEDGVYTIDTIVIARSYKEAGAHLTKMDKGRLMMILSKHIKK